jgi:hypothetical protein
VFNSYRQRFLCVAIGYTQNTVVKTKCNASEYNGGKTIVKGNDNGFIQIGNVFQPLL